MKPVVVIPALNPRAELLAIVDELRARGLEEIVVVDDGSGPAAADVFAGLPRDGRLALLHHAGNRGKGAALKTAFRHVLETRGDAAAIVTMDADGQHAVSDVAAVGACLESHPDHLVIGSRRFSGRVPFRSWVGNTLTRWLMRVVAGLSLRDSQSGLRGIPGTLARRLLAVRSSRFEFELEMLLRCRQLRVPIRELPITTIYIAGNRSSHFDPLLDSVRIYARLFRFPAAYAVGLMLDRLAAAGLRSQGLPGLAGEAASRVAAAALVYLLLRDLPAATGKSPFRAVLQHAALVGISLLASPLLAARLGGSWAVPVLQVAAWLALFAGGREVVFRAPVGSIRPAP